MKETLVKIKKNNDENEKSNSKHIMIVLRKFS